MEETNNSKDKFTPNDLYESCPVTKRLVKIIGLQNFKQIAGLSCSIFLPLIILSLVTFKENRFFYGSVTMPLEKHGDILGMSFLGDTMVWPFTIIVPITFILLKYSFHKSTELLNRICLKASEEWIVDKHNGFDNTVEKVKNIFNLKVGWQGKFLKIFPWIIALLFWSYNTTTCALHDFIDNSIYPYKSDTVVVLKNSDIPSAESIKAVQHPTTIKLGDKINLPKWDCDLKGAPLSTISARLWTFFYYGLPPFILSRLITLIWGVSYFLLAICRWEEKKQDQAIKLEPFGEDGFGGLSYLADTGISYLYIIVSFMLLLTMSFLKEGSEPSWHNYILLIAFIPIAFLSLIAPTIAIRKPIVRAKEDYLKIIINEINELSHKILNQKIKVIASFNSEKNHYFQHHRLSSLKLLYNHVSSIPEWPFSIHIYFKSILTIIIPVGMSLIKLLLTFYE